MMQETLGGQFRGRQAKGEAKVGLLRRAETKAGSKAGLLQTGRLYLETNAKVGSPWRLRRGAA